MKIVLIGAGNLATHLGASLREAQHEIVQVYSRTERSAQQLAHQLSCSYTTDLHTLHTDADIYIYALKDDIIHQVMQQVHIPHALHLHTAGSVSLFQADNGNYGVMYPLQTLSKERPINFQEIPICIEANNCDSLHIIRTLALSISDNVHIISSEQRRQLHLAAIYACNFVNCLYTNAEEIMENAQLPFELLCPLIQETAAKVKEIRPSNAQTGPAKRGDTKVMQHHLDLLHSDLQKEIYRLLSKDIHMRHNK